MDVDLITGEIVDAAVNLHKQIGPGLLESVYESVMARELARRGLKVERQRSLGFEIDGLRFEEAVRVDLLINELVVVELKSVEKLAPVHTKQLLTYLRVLDLRVGLLLNFGEAYMKDGIHRVVNGYESSASRLPSPRLRVSPPL